MSAIQQMLFAGRAPVTVSGTVYGSGSLAIPAGVTSVSLTGQGGSGSAATYGYVNLTPGYMVSVSPTTVYATTAGVLPEYFFYTSFPAANSVTLTEPFTGAVAAQELTSFGSWVIIYRRYSSAYDGAGYGAWVQATGTLVNGANATTGPSTTATLNGVTNTWAGGYGGAGAPSSQPLSSTGAGQTLTYNVGSGGYLTYSYTY